MKKLNDLLNQDPQQLVGHERQEKDNLLRLKRKKVELKLWDRLTEIYGHQMASQYGEQMPESWERLLREITPNQIATGLNRLVDRTETWPPNAVEFRKLCLPANISPNGGNSEAYMSLDDPRRARNNPNSQEYVKPEPTQAIDHKGYVSKRKKAGKAELSKLKGMFE